MFLFRIKNHTSATTKLFIDSPLSSKNRIAFQDAMTNIIAANMRHKHKFTHTVCKQYIWTLNVGMFFPKNFYLVKTISTTISRMQSAGIVQKIIDEFVDMKYWNLKAEAVLVKPLSMKHLEGAFSCLLLLCLASILVFILELAYSAFSKFKRNVLTET